MTTASTQRTASCSTTLRTWRPRPSKLALPLLVTVALLSTNALLAQQIEVQVGDGEAFGLLPDIPLFIPFDVDVTGAGGENLATLTVEIGWDPFLIAYASTSPGDFGTVSIDQSQVGLGRLGVHLTNPVGTTSLFRLIWVDLQTTLSATNTSIWVSVSSATNQQGQDVSSLISTDDLELCYGILGAWGEVNADRRVNIIDAQQIARHSVGLPVAAPAAMADFGDVTGEGSINIIDAQQIARSSVGLWAVPRIAQPKPTGCP